MSVLNKRSIVVAVAVVAIFLLSVHRTQAEVCNGDLTKLGEVCQQFVLKPGPQKDPSPECCHVIQSADVPCCCANIPKGLEDIISMEKVVYVAKFCGKPLKGGSKCGSYTVPPMAPT